MKNNQRFLQAFSIIELLLVLAIMGILSIIVIPSWCDFVERNRAIAFVNELSAVLKFTRASPIKFGEPVFFCGSKNGETCDGEWDQGQIVITGSGQVIRVLPKIKTEDRLVWVGSLGAKNKIKFLSDGYLNEQRGHFCYCPAGRSTNAVGLVLNSSGRMRLIRDDNKDIKISCGSKT